MAATTPRRESAHGGASAGADVPPARVELRLLGAPRILLGDAWRPLPADRRGQLLAFLALDGEWVTRDRLADLLWPDLTMAAARRNLRHLVHTIARRAPVPGLEAAREALRWSVDSDVARFRAALASGTLEDAVASYTGPLLEGFEARAAGAFGAWLEVEREVLRRRHRDAVVELVRREAAAGRPERAAAFAMRIVDGPDVDEEAALLAARALGDAGSPERARSVLDVYAGTLARELGAGPGERVRRLAASLTAPAAVGAPPEARLTGREAELDLMDRWFAGGDRLVTLLGPPGIGKSALARGALGRRVAAGDRGAAVVMAGATDVRAAASRLARGLGGLLDEGASPEAGAAALAEPYGLVVLDDVEVSAAAAALVDAILRRPGPRLLVVAPEPLQVATERVLHVEGLAYAGAPGRADDASSPAAELFVSLARRRDPWFAAVPERLDSVRRIVAAVEGSPLAIELAAAWVGALPLEEIERRMASEPDFLAEPGRLAPERHRSLRAAYAHAVRLLGAEERVALQRLGIFPAAFSLEAATAVGRTSSDVVARLVRRALLRRDAADRYALPHALKPFVREALRLEPVAEEEARSELVRFAASLARDALDDDAVVTPAAVAAVDRDQPNLVAAFEAAAARGDGDAVDDLGRGLAAWFEVRGRHGDAQRLFAAQLGSLVPLGRSRRPWLRLAWLQHWHDPEGAMDLVHGIAEQGDGGDPLDALAAARTLGTAAWRLGRYDEGRQHLERGLALARQAGHDGWRAILLDGLGLCLAARGAHATAERAQREALLLNERLGTTYQMVQNLVNLAAHARRRDDVRASVGHAQRAVDLAEATDYLPYLAHARTQLALALLAAGRSGDALAAAEAGVAGALCNGDGYVRIWSALVLASVSEAVGRADAPSLLAHGLAAASGTGDTKQLARGLLTAARFARVRDAPDLAALLAAAVEVFPGAVRSTRREARDLRRSLVTAGHAGTPRDLRRRARALGLRGVMHEFEAAVAAWRARI
jgi:DNA-binding SARP family transcriptional activator/predicted ATPase